jgi:hypothetical protein
MSDDLKENIETRLALLRKCLVDNNISLGVLTDKKTKEAKLVFFSLDEYQDVKFVSLCDTLIISINDLVR